MELVVVVKKHFIVPLGLTQIKMNENTWLCQFFLELIKHKVVFLISALSMVWDYPFNLLEPIWMHKILP
jgi:hypothetical protein